MNSSRRKFLKTSGIAVASVSVFKQNVFAAAKELVGVQLYSVRDAMKADPSGTLRKLASGGYKYVEHAGYADGKFYGYTPVEFKKLMDGMGLKMPSGHTVMRATDWDAGRNDFTDMWKKTVADAATVGQQFVISPWLDKELRADIDGLKKMMDQFNKCGELCKSHGMKFGYHNHNFEFTNKAPGGNLFDFILLNTDASLVAQQLDMGNMFGVGAKAIDYLKKYPGQFQLLHVKDEIKTQGGGEMGDGVESTILGKGIMPVQEILAVARKTGGSTHYIIEQEAYQGKDPVDCCITDLQVMKKWGYA